MTAGPPSQPAVDSEAREARTPVRRDAAAPPYRFVLLGSMDPGHSQLATVEVRVNGAPLWRTRLLPLQQQDPSDTSDYKEPVKGTSRDTGFQPFNSTYEVPLPTGSDLRLAVIWRGPDGNVRNSCEISVHGRQVTYHNTGPRMIYGQPWVITMGVGDGHGAFKDLTRSLYPWAH